MGGGILCRLLPADSALLSYLISTGSFPLRGCDGGLHRSPLTTCTQLLQAIYMYMMVGEFPWDKRPTTPISLLL